MHVRERCVLVCALWYIHTHRGGCIARGRGGGGQSGVTGQLITRNRRLKIVFVHKKYHKNTNNPLFPTEVQVMVARYIFFK